LVAEPAGAVVARDLRRQGLPDAEVARAPCDDVAKSEQPTRSFDELLASRRRRGEMRFDGARKVENALSGGSDLDCELDDRHETAFSRPLRHRRERGC